MPEPTPLLIRDARADERSAVRALTLRAYAEYATIMSPTAWAGLDAAVRAALDGDAPAERVVAELGGVVVGSVFLYPPAADAYAGLAGPPADPELRLLAVALRMYERLGFVRAPEHDFRPDGAELVMAYRLLFDPA